MLFYFQENIIYQEEDEKDPALSSFVVLGLSHQDT